MKIISNYLPQYHQIPENDLWWGEGYTDWIATKNARPLFAGHRQPRVPLHGYYSLDNPKHINAQAELAREYGIDAFGIYHYWFSSNMMLLQKPAELILAHPDIDIEFMFIWDNQSWRRSWSAIEKGNDWAPCFDKEAEVDEHDNGMLAILQYGDKTEWKKHFDYLLPFFKDDRYIKVENKPMFAIMRADDQFDTLKKMINYWNELAIDAGFNGMYCMLREYAEYNRKGFTFEKSFRYCFDSQSFLTRAKRLYGLIRHKLGIDPILTYNYDSIWKDILREAKSSKSSTILSGFVNYDDTPRRADKGFYLHGASPEKFKKYLRELVDISEKQGKDFLFLAAWNEWGEGMYLEPDTNSGLSYLEAVKEVIST